MTRTIFQMIATIAAVPLCAHYLQGVQVVDMRYALIAGTVLSLIYLVLRPLVKLVTKVFSFLTLGLLSVVIDAWMVNLCALLTEGAFSVDSFWWACAVALVVNALRFVVGLLFRRN